MPVEEIAEAAGKLVGRVAWDFCFHVIVEVVGYFLGFWTLRVLSFGSYPPREPSLSQVHYCQILGTLELLAPIVAFTWFHFTA